MAMPVNAFSYLSLLVLSRYLRPKILGLTNEIYFAENSERVVFKAKFSAESENGNQKCQKWLLARANGTFLPQYVKKCHFRYK